MISINNRSARAWARMGPRAMYGQFLLEMARANPRVIALSADLGRSSGLGAFAKELPNQFFNVGIAEQNLIGISSGLARMKFNVFCTTFAPFASLRAGEQVRMNMGYMQEPVKLVALASGFALGFLGNSHFGIEDIAIMRSIPGITIISPADCIELYKSLKAIEKFNKPVYLRLTGGVGMPVVYEKDYNFEIGKGKIIKPINKITIISHGTTVGHSLKAVNELEEQGHTVGLINMHTIKPLDEALLKEVMLKSEKVLVFEEHTVIGGLGSAILEFVNSNSINDGANLLIYGVEDYYPKTGDYPFMLETLKLNSKSIKSRVTSAMN